MRARPAHPGLTLLEVVVATAMLATLASAVLGAMTFMESYHARTRHRLDAMEVGHRLVTQYIDNQDLMPPQNLPIQQGDRLYRWTLREEILVREENDTGLRKRIGKNAADVSAMDQIPEMLNRLTVMVYLDDAEDPRAAVEPAAQLVRIYSPIFSGDQEEVLKRIIKLVERAQAEEAQSNREAAKAAREKDRK